MILRAQVRSRNGGIHNHLIVLAEDWEGREKGTARQEISYAE